MMCVCVPSVVPLCLSGAVMCVSPYRFTDWMGGGIFVRGGSVLHKVSQNFTSQPPSLSHTAGLQLTLHLELTTDTQYIPITTQVSVLFYVYEVKVAHTSEQVTLSLSNKVVRCWVSVTFLWTGFSPLVRALSLPQSVSNVSRPLPQLSTVSLLIQAGMKCVSLRSHYISKPLFMLFLNTLLFSCCSNCHPEPIPIVLVNPNLT